MAKVFNPITDSDGNELSVFILASSPHPTPPDGQLTEYKISIGKESWTDEPLLKIQMVYDGKVSGRKCPSYPVNRRDLKRISDEIEKLLQRWDDVMQSSSCQK